MHAAESVEYRALSYCWEGSTKPATLYVDGIPVKIGQNLNCALHQLRTNLFYCTNLLCSCSDDYRYPATLERHITSPELLWIDALCINQNDLEERSTQVAMMKDIYARAAEVVIWLGQEI
jgi:Heterokaryon incompatibility protein (HET)